MQADRLEPNRSYDIVICILDDGQSLTFRSHLPNGPLRVLLIDPRLLNDLPDDARIPKASYLRLFMPQLLRADYDQILYMDTDMYMRHACVSTLMELCKTLPHAVSACADGVQWQERLDAVWTKYLGNSDLDVSQYLNAGLLVIDVERYLADGVLEQLGPTVRRLGTDLTYHDQSALNAILRGQWNRLSPRWNWQTMRFADRLIDEFDPHILHFVAVTKPWIRGRIGPIGAYLAEYQAFFQTHYGIDLTEGLGRNTGYLDRDFFALISSREFLQKLNPLYHTPLRAYFDRRMKIARTRKALLKQIALSQA